MKRKTIFWFSSSMLFFLLLVVAGCGKDDDNKSNDVIYQISATMSSANEVPVNTSTGTGTASGTYNATTNVLSYNIAWSGLTGAATVGHFHSPALPGANANPLIHFNLQANNTATGVATLTEAQEADLLAGKFYANIHTAANPGGEIRGQVAATK